MHSPYFAAFPQKFSKAFLTNIIADHFVPYFIWYIITRKGFSCLFTDILI